jgi:hypothetical protein
VNIGRLVSLSILQQQEQLLVSEMFGDSQVFLYNTEEEVCLRRRSCVVSSILYVELIITNAWSKPNNTLSCVLYYCRILAFFIPYLLALVFIGLPLTILEIGFGQYFQTGDIGVFGTLELKRNDLTDSYLVLFLRHRLIMIVAFFYLYRFLSP